MSAKKQNLVVGLGKTGLSIARYLKRADANAIFFDSREEPPGLDELNEIYPDAEVLLGDAKLPKNIDRVIASPGVPDSQPLLKKAISKKLDVVSDIELFAREATAPFVAITGSNGKSTVTAWAAHLLNSAGTAASLRRRSTDGIAEREGAELIGRPRFL